MNATNPAVQYVVAIEGFGWLLTNGPTAAAVTAWAGTDWSAALGGLEVNWNLDQRLHPWEPFDGSSSSVTLKIMDASGTNADTFGLAVFKREGMNTSSLYADVLPGSTTITVKRSSAFAASGTLYIGNEAIGYTSNDNGTNPGTFGTLTRGKWSPLESEGSTRFVRTHRTVPTVPGVPAPDVEAGTSALVADAPIDWRGRWVGVWIHRDLGGVLDTKAEAHLAFAGRISSVADSADGRTIVNVDSVQQVIGDAVVLREQWRAKVKPGVTLTAGTRFNSDNQRQGSSGGTVYADIKAADPLVVVPSGAATVNEINAGVYTGAEIEAAINDWLAAELAAGRLIFRQVFRYNDTDAAGNSRSSLLFSDDTVTVQLSRLWQVGVTDPDVGIMLGWTAGAHITGTTSGAYSGTQYSNERPLATKIHINATPGSFTTLAIEDVEGVFVDQSMMMYNHVAFAATGVLKIGDAYMPCGTPSVTNGVGTVTVGAPINQYLGSELVDGWNAITVENGGSIEVAQALVLESTFIKLTLALLSSMGGGLNWAAYDLLPAHCSANIPYALMGTGLEGEMTAAPFGLDVLTVVVDKPTRLVDLLGPSFTLRLIQFVWRQGRLALRGYATPTSAATLSIGVDVRATAIDTDDDLLAVTTESDALMRNVIKIKHNADATGDAYRDTITIVDPGSASNFGARPLTISARNAISGTGNAGEDIDGLLPMFVGGLAFLVRPSMVLRVPLDQTMIEQATPGEVVLVTDGFARDPATGVRGLTNKPALVLSQNASWGGPTEPPRCEVDLVIFPRLSLAEYSPCAQVDDTAATAGYVAGTKVLTCYAHEHSAAGAAADATLFLVGHKVRVVEMDPPTAAAPLTWDDVVAGQSGNTITLTTGLAGWDTSKKYRVISDTYGDALTAQRAKCYQADDADGQIFDLRAPYSMAFDPTGQVSGAADSVATELPCRPPTLAAGDGAALDTGHARDLARGLNNLISYKTAPQNPCALGSTEVMAYSSSSGSPTWYLVWCEPVFIGVGTTNAAITRRLYVSPTVLKSGAASADIRVTLARRLPKSADPSNPSRNDMTRLGPYSEHTFTTTSVTFETPVAVALAIDHLQLAPGHLGGGMGWLYVEIGNHASFRGMGTKYIGPLVTP